MLDIMGTGQMTACSFQFTLLCRCKMVITAVWRVQSGVCSVACAVWHVQCGVCSVACAVWRVACAVWRVQCCGMCSVACAVWRGSKNALAQMKQHVTYQPVCVCAVCVCVLCVCVLCVHVLCVHVMCACCVCACCVCACCVCTMYQSMYLCTSDPTVVYVSIIIYILHSQMPTQRTQRLNLCARKDEQWKHR